MSTTVDVEVVPRLMIEPPPLPRIPSIERLVEELTGVGFTELGADSIANAVCDPPAFRRAMQAPLTVRVPTGTLELVATRLWAAGVVTHPTNTRVSPWTNFAVSGLDGRPRLRRPRANPGGPAELLMEVQDRELLVGVMEEAAARLEDENPLDADIAADGIRESITVVAATVFHDDGTDPVGLLFAADGSSRISAAHRNLGINADAAAYRYGSSARLLRQRVGRSLALLGDGPLSDDDIAELNSLTVPAMVIIGYRPDEPHAGDFARAIDARVGGIHVNPPKAWSDAARFDAQLNAVIDQLASGYLGPTEVAYMAGDLSPEQALAADLTDLPDVRAADVLADVHNPDMRKEIHAALRSVGGRKAGYAERADVAAEAALRGFRTELTSQDAGLARTLLRHLYRMEEFRPAQIPWSVRRDLSLDELLEEVLDEQKDPGDRHATTELLALAVYWMARLALVRRATRSGDDDRTDISLVIRRMSESPWGARALHRIVADARKGRLPVRRVDRTGKGIKDEGGEYLPADETWMRAQWGEAGGDDEIVTPEARLAELRGQFETALNKAAELLDDFTEPQGPDGSPLVEQVGIPAEWARGLLGLCNEIVGDLAYYQRVGERSSDA